MAPLKEIEQIVGIIGKASHTRKVKSMRAFQSHPLAGLCAPSQKETKMVDQANVSLDESQS
jgi:hypothetical protein